MREKLNEARKALQTVEDFINENDYDIRITQDDDGRLHLWLVRKDEPCRY